MHSRFQLTAGFSQGWKKTRSFKKKYVFRFLGFNLQMPDTKLGLRPTSAIKSKDKSSKQRFGHVNATNPNSIFEYHNTIIEKLFKTLKSDF